MNCWAVRGRSFGFRVTLAIDENLPPGLAQAIDALLQPERGSAISIPQRLGRGVTDREWIAAWRQEEGWSVLTLDRRLRTRPHERAALDESGLLHTGSRLGA